MDFEKLTDRSKELMQDVINLAADRSLVDQLIFVDRGDHRDNYALNKICIHTISFQRT